MSTRAKVLAVIQLVLLLTACGGGGGDKPQSTVTWNQGTFNVTVVQGTSQISQITLNVSEQVNDASLVVGTEIAGVMRMSLLGNTALKPGLAVQVATEVSVSAATPPGTYEGTVTVLSGAQAMPTALTVKIQVVPGSSSQFVNQVADPSPDRVARTQSGQFLIKDEVLVALNGDIADPAARIKEIATNAGALIIGSVPGLPLYQLRFAGADVSTVESYREALRGTPGVRAVSLSLLGTGLKFAAEGLYPFDTWNEKQAAGPNGHLEFIRAPEAWDITTGATGEEAVRVAVIDSEFDREHPDLLKNIDLENSATSLYTNGLFSDGGHGTGVAGTICAEGGNGFGVVGVAWHCKLLLYNSTAAYFDRLGNVFVNWFECGARIAAATRRRCSALESAVRIADLMKKVIDKKDIRIVNISLGLVEPDCGASCTSPPPIQLAGDVNDILLAAFEYDKEKRVLWVIAAGNEGREASAQSPASFSEQYQGFRERIIVVAGAETDTIAGVNGSDVRVKIMARPTPPNTGSNFGHFVDVAAPWFVATTYPRLCQFVPLTPGLGKEWKCELEDETEVLPFTATSTSYRTGFGGTSAAAPQVAGLAVLVMSKHPAKTAAQVKTCIVDAANGHGATVTNPKNYPLHVINAVAAVECGPPVIAANQPADVAVAAGQQAIFTVNAEGTNLSFEWRKGTTFVDSVLALGVSNHTTNSSTFFTTATKPEDSGSTFFVVVRNKTEPVGVLSRLASLTVSSTPPPEPAPIVNSINPTTMVATGVSQTLTITGSGFTSGNIVQFRWGVGSGAGAWTTSASVVSVPSATQVLLQMNPGTVADTIYVRVCRSASQTATSDCSSGTAAVTVTTSTALPPAISGTGQPQNTTVTAGQTASFTVLASGTGPLTYQWRRNGVNVACAAEANCPTYTTPATTTGDNGAAYSVVVSNSVNSVASGTATLTVTSTTAAPTISAAGQPQSVTVIAGQTATFVVTATGTGLSHQWRKNGANVTCATGTNCPSYTTPTTTAADDGAIYSVVVSNTAGSVTSSNATLTVGAGVVLPLQRREIATGLYHSCALTSAGGVKCWGANSNSTLSAGQLGDGTSLTRLVPVDVVGLSSGVVAVTAGAFHTCALTTAGGVKCWGQNFGALGDGTELHRLTPVDVVGLGSGVVAISAGGGHTCALTSTGGVKCWGAMGGYGLGDGTTQDRLAPVDVVGLAGGAAAIAAGNTHTCALTGAGGVKCWGGNAGRLGDGTDQDSLIPVDVLGLGSGVMAITAGGSQTCAVTNAGGAKCWGNNVSGALGDGTTVNRRAPVDVTGLTSGVVALSAGDNHTCAVTSSGGVKCWGSSLSGQLGDGAFNVDRLAPVDVTGLSSGVTAVSAGGQHTCARTSAGGVKCWGFNGLGGLGDGTTNSRAVPLDVVGFQPAGNNPFMGNYAGSYVGGQSGTWAATINVDGTITATATGGFVGTGSVNSAGTATIALDGTGASQGFTITFSGAFALQSNGTMTGSGTWTSSSGLTGTWSGTRIN